MWNLKRKDTNELNKIEIDSQTLRSSLWLLGESRDSQGVWNEHVHTAMFKMDNQQGPIV